MRLKDRVALVTGSAKGIGRGIAMALGDEGARVVLNDIEQTALDRTESELRERGVDVLAVRADVTASSEVAAMVKRVVEHFGRIDILVNNAGGGMQHPVHLLELTEEMWDKCVDLNLKSVFLVSREVLPLMIRQGKGNIVNISSTTARYGNERMRPHYTAAKTGVLGLTRHMAREFGPQGIRVNAICPGYCLSGERVTGLWATERPDKEEILATVALRRTSTPAEQAAAVVFLASDESSYITGATVDVSGGRFSA